MATRSIPRHPRPAQSGGRRAMSENENILAIAPIEDAQFPASEYDLASLKELAVGHWTDSVASARKTMRSMWNSGQMLAEIKRRETRGEWIAWLDEADIAPRTAQGLMRFSTMPKAELANYDSQKDVLKALTKPKADEPKYAPAAHLPPKSLNDGPGEPETPSVSHETYVETYDEQNPPPADIQDAELASHAEEHATPSEREEYELTPQVHAELVLQHRELRRISDARKRRLDAIKRMLLDGQFTRKDILARMFSIEKRED